MQTFFTIKNYFKNNTHSKEVFVKNILSSSNNKFKSIEDGFQITLLRGRSEIEIQSALLNVTDNEILITSAYNKTIKTLIILQLVLAFISAIVYLSCCLIQFSINKNFKTLLLIYPIMTLIMFIVSRIVLQIKTNKLIEDLEPV